MKMRLKAKHGQDVLANYKTSKESASLTVHTTYWYKWRHTMVTMVKSGENQQEMLTFPPAVLIVAEKDWTPPSYRNFSGLCILSSSPRHAVVLLIHIHKICCQW